MEKNKKVIIGVTVLLIVLAGLIWMGKPSPSQNTSSLDAQLGGSGSLFAEEQSYDFGEISMAKGDVSHQFKIKNSGSNPVEISKLYTSCMCTTASLVMGDNKRSGPFGMPGHGFVPKINKSLAPGEEAVIEVVFDPAAHGPAGVGRIERVVYVESGSDALELGFTALVRP